MFLSEMSTAEQIQTWFTNLITDFKDDFYLNFIQDDRWVYLAKGLGTTILIAFLSVLVGIVLGFIKK